MYRKEQLKQLMFPLGIISSFIILLLIIKLAIFLSLKVDFTSFYVSFRAYNHGDLAYTLIPLDILKKPTLSLMNLNPPFFLVLFAPLAKLSYTHAFYVWHILSCLTLMIAGHLTLTHSKLKSSYYLLPLLFTYPVLMNFLLGQITAFIYLLIILGYDYSKKGYPLWAGGFWGLATGIKLFPGLLIFYALSKKQYKLCAAFCLTVLVTILIPYLIDGLGIYIEYFKGLQYVNWYRYTWNVSLTGYIFRVADNNLLLFGNIFVLKCITSTLVGLLAISYGYLMMSTKEHIKHQRFNITIIYMLLLNPITTFYYLPLLLIPLSSLISQFKYFSLSKKLSLLFVLFLLLWPVGPNHLRALGTLVERATIYSQYFYGVLFSLFMILWCKPNTIKQTAIKFKLDIVLTFTVMTSIYAVTFYMFFYKLGAIYFNS